MASWKDSARSVGASSGASVHLSSEYDMVRFLSMLPEEDDDEEFPGEHAGSPAAGRMVVPPIAAIPFVTESKSLAYELYWMLESSLVENCSVVMTKTIGCLSARHCTRRSACAASRETMLPHPRP